MQILVITEAQTPRIRYIFSHILSQLMGFDVVFSQNENDASSFKGPVISYTKIRVSNTVHITPHPLLSLKGVDEQAFAFFSWRDFPAFFPTCDNSDIPFDLFAASFYLLARYEEYLPHHKDSHGRFRAEDSIAYKMKFLEIPIVDLWVKELEKIIIEKYPNVEVRPKQFTFIPTIDIDNAYAYRYKGFLRAFMGTGRSFIHFNILDFYRRIAVYLRLMPDPYNTYRKLFRILSHHPQSIWFFLGGKYGEFDKSIPLHKKPIKKLLERIGRHFTIGIHPSYASQLSKKILKKELTILTSISGKEINTSRQHFLKIKFPDTFNILVDLGIKDDFSLGYSTAVGFRAGTCCPFRFYDILADNEFPIVLTPFQVMDRALLDGLKLKPENAIEKTLEIAQRVKDVNGTFVLAWHNESLSGINEWKGWEGVLKEIVEKVKNLQE